MCRLPRYGRLEEKQVSRAGRADNKFMVVCLEIDSLGGQDRTRGLPSASLSMGRRHLARAPVARVGCILASPVIDQHDFMVSEPFTFRLGYGPWIPKTGLAHGCAVDRAVWAKGEPKPVIYCSA